MIIRVDGHWQIVGMMLHSFSNKLLMNSLHISPEVKGFVFNESFQLGIHGLLPNFGSLQHASCWWSFGIFFGTFYKVSCWFSCGILFMLAFQLDLLLLVVQELVQLSNVLNDCKAVKLSTWSLNFLKVTELEFEFA